MTKEWRAMLRVSAEKFGDVAVLHLRGRIVIGDAIETLRDAVRGQADACAVVLDLWKVDRIDARGLGTLLELREWALSKGIEFRLMNVNRPVEQVLKITCLNTVFRTSSEERVRRVIPEPASIDASQLADYVEF
jgi:anti-anti-sigma factor